MRELAFVLPAVFVVVDPLGVLPAFIAMTARDSAEKARRMALRACLAGGGLLLFFAFFGALLFKFFGVTLPAFRVAGGLLLMLTALDMLRARPVQTRSSEEELREGEEKDDIAIIPLAMPLLAGPGSIATVMVLVAEGKDAFTGAAVAASVVLTFLATYLLLRAAAHVKRALGQTGLAVLQRLSGLILASLAVQIVAEGARALLKL